MGNRINQPVYSEERVLQALPKCTVECGPFGESVSTAESIRTVRGGCERAPFITSSIVWQCTFPKWRTFSSICSLKRYTFSSTHGQLPICAQITCLAYMGERPCGHATDIPLLDGREVYLC